MGNSDDDSRDYIKRPEFNELRDHVDDQHVRLFQHVSDTEISMLGKLTQSSRWLIGTFIGVFIVMGGVYFSSLDKIDVNLQSRIDKNTLKVERQDEIIHRSIQQSLANSIEIQNTANLLGAQIQNSGITNSALIDKVALIKENTQLQINDLKQRLDNLDKKNYELSSHKD